MAKKVGVINLEKAFKEILAEFGNEAYGNIEWAVGKVSDGCVQRLKAVDHFASGRRPSGAYSSSWTKTVMPTKRLYVKTVVHNEEHYRLTHLLEKGHVSRNGTGRTFGRVPAYPHIAPVQEWAEKELYDQVKGCYE